MGFSHFKKGQENKKHIQMLNVHHNHYFIFIQLHQKLYFKDFPEILTWKYWFTWIGTITECSGHSWDVTIGICLGYGQRHSLQTTRHRSYGITKAWSAFFISYPATCFIKTLLPCCYKPSAVEYSPVVFPPICVANKVHTIEKAQHIYEW